ncbi:hypothetical protein HRbin41_01451 [bacterium HR41]|nr:hypothetical protein HRbin41_01451 [bacterium HR41]
MKVTTLEPHTVEKLVAFDSGGLPTLSLYVAVPTDPNERQRVASRVNSLLSEARQLVKDHERLDHEQRLSLRDDIARIEEAVARELPEPPALAIFACSGAGLFERVRLPGRVRDRAVVDKSLWLRPLLAQLDAFHRYCVVVLDRRRAELWELFAGEFKPTAELDAEHLRKRDFAGWYGLEEHRVRNRAEQLAHRHFRAVAEELEQVVRLRDIELLLVGGQEHEVRQFVRFLSPRLRARVAATFAVDLDNVDPRKLQQAAEEAARRYEEREERELVERVLAEAARGNGAVAGLDACLWAGSVGAIGLLVVDGSGSAAGVRCPSCGWLGRAGERCPLCDTATVAVPDVLDDLAEEVIAQQGTVEHIEVETPLREQLVAAELRFPPPPPPAAAE